MLNLLLTLVKFHNISQHNSRCIFRLACLVRLTLQMHPIELKGGIHSLLITYTQNIITGLQIKILILFSDIIFFKVPCKNPPHFLRPLSRFAILKYNHIQSFLNQKI